MTETQQHPKSAGLHLLVTYLVTKRGRGGHDDRNCQQPASILSYHAQGRSKVLSSRRPRSRREHSIGSQSFKPVDFRWDGREAQLAQHRG